MDKIDERYTRIQKLKILSEKGSPGEKENAKFLLEKICKKYNISLDQIESSDEIEMRWFKYKNSKFSKELLSQCIYKILGPEHDMYTRGKLKELGVKCTISEAIEIQLDYDFFQKHLNKEIKMLYSMFIQRNNIFYPLPDKTSKEDSKSKEPTPEEVAMYCALKKHSRTLQIESGDE